MSNLLNDTAGRTCPLRYRYGANSIVQAPEQRAETLYVIGGLYGNLPALDVIEDIAVQERGPVTLCFNGDFNWFNIDDMGFRAINERVLACHALSAPGVRAPAGGPPVGGRVYALVQPGASAQRPAFRHARRAPCGPGQRAVTFLKSLAFDPMENEGPAMPGMDHGTGHAAPGMASSRLPLGVAFNVLKFSVTAGERSVAKLPGALSKVSPVPIQGATQRKIELSMGNMRFLINGRTFVMDEIAFDVKRGAVEVWSISNPALGMPHPMHIHGFSFQVLERLNSPAQVSASARFGKVRTVGDLGWKDTVLVWPGETVRIAIDFTHDFPGDQTYLLHCHNFEHEDAGMMINFRVQG